MSTGLKFHPQGRRHGLDGAELTGPGRIAGIPQDCHPGDVRCDLLEQLQPFRAEAVFEEREASDVAARPRQARNETGTDRIGSLHEHDRHGAGRLLHLN
jgi:hypothetical protein